MPLAIQYKTKIQRVEEKRWSRAIHWPTWKKWSDNTLLREKAFESCCNRIECTCREKERDRITLHPDGVNQHNIYNKPLVTPVNYRGDIVLNRAGHIMGPITHEQWTLYAYDAIQMFHDLRQHKHHKCEYDWHPKTATTTMWADAYFRHTADFKAGTLHTIDTNRTVK